MIGPSWIAQLTLDSIATPLTDGSSTATAVISTTEETCYKDVNHPVSFFLATPSPPTLTTSCRARTPSLESEYTYPHQNDPARMEN